MPPPNLYHFSEDPGIECFVPHVAKTALQSEAYVWAIDGAHAFHYFAPRNCPRACFWPGERTSEADRARWFGAVDARAVIAIESAWLDRVRMTALYRYTLPSATFRPFDADAGHWVSEAEVAPTSVEPVGDLLAAIVAAGVELRITPSLIDLWNAVIRSTLHFSGTRLRNARGYERVVPP